MWDFDLMAATRSLEKSMPFTLYRFVFYFGAGIAYLLATLAGAGTLIGFASLSKNANSLGPLGAVIGFLACAFVMYKLRPYWLRHIKVGQLALLADLAKGESLPAGAAQIDYAKKRIAKLFPSSSALFGLDQTLRQALGEMAENSGKTEGAASTGNVARLIESASKWLFARNDQSLLALEIQKPLHKTGKSAANGLAIQFKNRDKLMKNRLYACVFEWFGFALAYPLLLIGIRMLVEGLPINTGIWPHVFAAVFAWVLKAAFFEPIAEAAMLQVFLPMASQEPQTESSAELAEVSPAYRKLLQEQV